MIRGVFLVGRDKESTHTSKQNENSFTEEKLNTDHHMQQLGKKAGKLEVKEPCSRGIPVFDELNNHLFDDEDLNLLASETSEDKSVEQFCDFSNLTSKSSNSPKEFLSSKKQVFSQQQEVAGNHRTPEKSMETLETPFDTAPGFQYAKKSTKNSRKTKQEKTGTSLTFEQFQHSGLGKAPSEVKFQERNWTRFEGEKEDVSLLARTEGMPVLESGESNISSPIHAKTVQPPSQSYVSFDDNNSQINTPILTKCWVSFEEDSEHKFSQSKLSESLVIDNPAASSAIFHETVIPDLFEIANELPSSKYSHDDEKHVDHSSKKDDGDDITNTFAKTDRQNVNDDFDTDSNFSGEICDLNNLENDSLLRDTRKPFPKEGIFQASSCKKSPEKNSPRISSKVQKTINFELIGDNDSSQLDDYPLPSSRTEWTFLYRYPDHKKRFTTREWVTVRVKIENDAIHLSGRLENTDIMKEIPLHPFFVFTLPVLHSNNGHGKVHSVKLQYVKYKETRKMSSKFQLEHIPSYTPVLKLASKDHKSMREFIENVENVVRKIECHRDKGITHRHEEIFIDCDDICQYELDGNGKIKQYNITCLIRLRAFITGIPDLYLFLNDISSYNKQKNKRTNGRQPKNNRWIRLENIEYHPSVDVAATNTEGGIVFKPPDSCSFELMRFRVHNRREVPALFKASIDFTTSKSFEIRAECKIGGESKTMKYRRTNIVVRFPIPTTWTSVFVKSRSFSGQKKYIQAKADQKTFASGIGRTARCSIEVSTGSARYEPEYSSLVWRVGDLPILASGVPADAVQTLICQVNLPFDIDFTWCNDLCAEVEYEISHAVGSEIQVQEVLLSDGRMPDKWVCYRALYFYNVMMTILNQQRLASVS